MAGETYAAPTCAVLLPRVWAQGDLEQEMNRDVRTVAWAQGPHSRSNWLPVGGKERLQLCVGGWPFRLPEAYGIAVGETEQEGEAKVRNILGSGITTFVNLTKTNEGFISGNEYGYQFWMPRVLAIAESVRGDHHAQVASGNALRFDLSCEIRDEGVTSDEVFARLLQQIFQELGDARRILYVHCYGGHGRAGLVCCSILCLLYPWLQSISEDMKDLWTLKPPWHGLPSSRFGLDESSVSALHNVVSSEGWEKARGAITVFNRFHAEREDEHGGGPCRFPHSIEQLAQVIRVAQGWGCFETLPRIGELPKREGNLPSHTPPSTPPAQRPKTPMRSFTPPLK